MTQGNFKLNIDDKLTEQQLVETCLMCYHSGYDYKLLFFLYAFGKHWNIDKLEYYLNLIEDTE